MKKSLVLLLVISFFYNEVAGSEKEINPTPVLMIEGLGNGYSTPAITSDRIFVTGEREGIGYLSAYDFKGNLLWKTTYGKEWADNYPGSRSSPTVRDSLIYTSSGLGDIGCFNIKTGEKQWILNMIQDLHGVNAVFGHSIPVLVEKDRIYCLPGGPDTNIACLNRETGKVIWVSKGNGETPGYASLLIIRHHDRNLLVAFSELTLLGLDTDTGELLWTYELSVKGDAPCNQPIYSKGFLYIVAGNGNGAVKFEISEDGSQIKKIWNNIEFDTYFGGVVMINNFLFGSSDSQRLWWSIDTETGKIADSLPFRTGATISAGEDLILYNQNGKVGLVQLKQGKMILVKYFEITKGTKEHFSHPIIAGGWLYIRHGDVLLAYDYQQLIKS